MIWYQITIHNFWGQHVGVNTLTLRGQNYISPNRSFFLEVISQIATHIFTEQQLASLYFNFTETKLFSTLNSSFFLLKLPFTTFEDNMLYYIHFTLRGQHFLALYTLSFLFSGYSKLQYRTFGDNVLNSIHWLYGDVTY